MKHFTLETEEKLTRVHKWKNLGGDLSMTVSCSENGFQSMKLQFGVSEVVINNIAIVEDLYSMLASFIKIREEKEK